MNRADQAVEPSMEELLASIRLIISDSDKKAPSGGFARTAADNTPGDSAEGDEVLDLTDDLVFAERGERSPPADRPAVEVPKPSTSRKEAGGPASNRETPSPAKRPEAAPHVRREEIAAPSKPLWSRRELSIPGSEFEPSAVRSRQEPAAPKPQRGWHGDVQMAITEHGPVSLISTGDGRNGPGLDEHEDAVKPSGGMAGNEEAVAALAQSLARSAAGAMETSELETAQRLDFKHIDEGSKADVAEKFAEVIEKQSAAAVKPGLPNLFNEVVWGDFRREPDEGEAVSESKKTDSVEAGSGRGEEAQDAAFEEDQPSSGKPPRPAGVVQNAKPQTPLSSRSRHSEPSAQALVPSPSQIPAKAAGALEEAVRDMLRPLLVQWLNENMPRILESAIREEIAARGIFPSKDN